MMNSGIVERRKYFFETQARQNAPESPSLTNSHPVRKSISFNSGLNKYFENIAKDVDQVQTKQGEINQENRNRSRTAAPRRFGPLPPTPVGRKRTQTEVSSQTSPSKEKKIDVLWKNSPSGSPCSSVQNSPIPPRSPRDMEGRLSKLKQSMSNMTTKINLSPIPRFRGKRKNSEGEGEKEIPKEESPRARRLTPQPIGKDVGENVRKKLLQDTEKCARSLRTLEKRLGDMDKFCSKITEGFSSNKNLAIVFKVGNLKTGLLDSIKNEEKEFLINSYKELFLVEDGFLKKKPLRQEKGIDNFKKQISRFIDETVKLKDLLEQPDVSIHDLTVALEKKKIKDPDATNFGITINDLSEDTTVDKTEILMVLNKFCGEFAKTLDRLYLPNFNRDLQSDKDATQKTFDLLKKYFVALKDLEEVYIKYIGYHSFEIYQAGKPCRISTEDNRFDEKDEEVPTKEAKSALNQISRELSQYSNVGGNSDGENGSILKDLNKKAQKIADFVNKHELPFPSQLGRDGFRDLLELARKLQKGIEKHDSIFQKV